MKSRHFTLTDQHDYVVMERAEQMRGNKSAALRSLIDDAQGRCFRPPGQLRTPLKEIAAHRLDLRRQRPTATMLCALEKIEQAALEAEALVMKAG